MMRLLPLEQLVVGVVLDNKILEAVNHRLDSVRQVERLQKVQTSECVRDNQVKIKQNKEVKLMILTCIRFRIYVSSEQVASGWMSCCLLSVESV